MRLTQYITDTPTKENGTKPQILTKFANAFKSINPAIIELPIPANPIVKVGTPVCLLIFESDLGNSPSRLIAKNTCVG
ncbi:hypothetical protein BAC7755_32810 [Bacillus sp. MN7755]